MYAKKIREAPVQTPWRPPGKKGCQLAGFTWKAPTTMKKSRVRTFRTTTTLLKRADSLTPRTRSHVMAAVIDTASRLQTTGIAEEARVLEVGLVGDGSLRAQRAARPPAASRAASADER